MRIGLSRIASALIQARSSPVAASNPRPVSLVTAVTMTTGIAGSSFLMR